MAAKRSGCMLARDHIPKLLITQPHQVNLLVSTSYFFIISSTRPLIIRSWLDYHESLGHWGDTLMNGKSGFFPTTFGIPCFLLSPDYSRILQHDEEKWSKAILRQGAWPNKKKVVRLKCDVQGIASLWDWWAFFCCRKAVSGKWSQDEHWKTSENNTGHI